VLSLHSSNEPGEFLQWSYHDDSTINIVITFRMRHSRGEMYSGHGRLCVCLFLAAFPHYSTDLYVTWGNGKECRLVVHYWAYFQSVHGFRCCDNIHISKLIALYTENAYNTKREVSASACTLNG